MEKGGRRDGENEQPHQAAFQAVSKLPLMYIIVSVT